MSSPVQLELPLPLAPRSPLVRCPLLPARGDLVNPRDGCGACSVRTECASYRQYADACGLPCDGH